MRTISKILTNFACFYFIAYFRSINSNIYSNRYQIRHGFLAFELTLILFYCWRRLFLLCHKTSRLLRQIGVAIIDAPFADLDRWIEGKD